MYLKRIHSVNVGPIEDAEINFPFADGNPKPVVIVGENGTGKSVLLSNIVDSFYEIASKNFSNARKQNEMSEGQQYYKVITSQEIHIGKEFMYSYLEYDHNSSPVYSIFKSGNLTIQEFQKLERDVPQISKWGNDNHYKTITATKDNAKDIFLNDVICYFGPGRYEKPNWMGDQYFLVSNFEHPSIKEKWNGRLDNPISVMNVTASTLQWLLDIIVDSRCDIEYKNNEWEPAYTNVQDIQLLKIARQNVEKIMGTILGEEIYFGLNYRNSNISRFNINLKANQQTIIPALDALSTGQSALFNMFATIIRYADSDDINKSITLENITGIVVIDEIELHLHTNLQRDILPKLLKLFPKVQFIISSHAPLFLLGMDEAYGIDGYEIYQMPSAIKISSERFSEFQKAYSYLSKTEKHHATIMEAIQKKQGKPLVVTEGPTDWKHMKAAMRHLFKQEEFQKKGVALDFEFLEYESENSKNDKYDKLKMGNKNLCTMCEQISKIKQSRKIIFIADADDKETNKKLSDSNKNYKRWGNNVFSFILPLPDSRKGTPEICIEHYYTDNEIKTVLQINGMPKRLYMGNEFNRIGISLDKKYYCVNRNFCGKDKINIIDGDEKTRVFSIDDLEGKENLALSKMDFAMGILDEKQEFEKIKFDNFRLIFNIIQQILQEPME